MWDIRTNSKYFKRLTKSARRFNDIKITLDENVEIPILMTQVKEGEFQEFLRGFELVNNFAKYGYNRISKNCPLRNKKCIAEKCSWYFIDNFTGDCTLIWQIFTKEVKISE